MRWTHTNTVELSAFLKTFSFARENQKYFNSHSLKSLHLNRKRLVITLYQYSLLPHMPVHKILMHFKVIYSVEKEFIYILFAIGLDIYYLYIYTHI